MSSIFSSNCWYNDPTFAVSTTYYFAYGNGCQTNGDTTEAYSQKTFRSAGTISGLSINIVGNVTTASSTFTLRHNGANGNETITIPANTTGYFVDNTHTDTIAAGDTVDYQLVIGAGTSFSPRVPGSIFSATTGTILHYNLNQSHTLTGTGAIKNYLPIAGYNGNGVNTTSDTNIQMNVINAFTLRNLYVYVSSNSRSTVSTVVSRVNGANGNLTVSIPAGTSGTFEDTTHTDSLAAGALVNCLATVGTGSGSLVMQNIAFEAYNSGLLGLQWVNGNSILAGASFSSTSYPSLMGALYSFGAETSAVTISQMLVQVSNLAAYIVSNTCTATSTIYLRKNFINGYSNLQIPASTTGYFVDNTDVEFLIPNDQANFKIIAGSGTLNINVMSIAVTPYTEVPHFTTALGCGN